MGRTFEDVHERLSQIVDEVSAEGISLDDALKLYEEAVKLGLSACDLSEQDIEAHLAADGEQAADAADSPASAGAPSALDGDGAPSAHPSATASSVPAHSPVAASSRTGASDAAGL